MLFLEEVIHYISNVEMTVVRQYTPWTQKHLDTNRLAHTRSSVWENRDRSQPDLTIAQRKRSIKQQVHFSAEAFKKHGHHQTAGALLERARNQPPLRFHSHVREGMFRILENETAD